MNENKNLILAVVLSALVLLGWSFLSDKFVPSNPPPVKVENGKVEPVQQPQASPSPNTPAAMRDRKPCRRLRTRLLGWKVRFIAHSLKI